MSSLSQWNSAPPTGFLARHIGGGRDERMQDISARGEGGGGGIRISSRISGIQRGKEYSGGLVVVELAVCGERGKK